MDLGLQDHVYVATGGSRGLGRAVAQELTAEGARVVVTGRGASVEDAARSLGGAEHAVGIVADNADPGSADLVMDAAQRHFGRVDGALVSVGGPPVGAAMEVGDQTWRDSFEATFLGAVRKARAAARAFTEGGSIAFVLSSSVREPIPGPAVSNGLRPGLAMVAKTLADELGTSGVRVNGLLPAYIDTERQKELEAVTGGKRPGNALRRSGTPEEFARAAVFLLSPAAAYLTGVMLPVDGGELRVL
ncbi:SDR family oxidoreductase [Streptomyces cadmiisoli]|uniref:Oxidoreductase n=1 Tax=Streptomyces cadmiisoli TaxID=2184053 RepID=A0A2Z4ITW0_9ACTN|nr:SDR family oxidoreductase [Streptomyces cadmiisoli]AWW35976.1 oxidoreductase [Streptomyces cadmiisoli]